MKKNVRGFTLIELLVTLALLGILATVALPLTQLSFTREREMQLQRALRDIRSALDAYKRSYDEGHITKKLGASGYPPSLSILVEGVTDIKDVNSKKIYFLRRLPRDPMCACPDLSAEETWAVRSYDSNADDPKTGDDVYDVMSKSEKEGQNGIPYKQW